MQWSKFWCSLLLTCRDWNISSSYCRVRKTDSSLYTWSRREYLIIYCWYQHEKNDGSILCSYSKHSCCTLTIYDVRGLTPVDYPSWENFSGWFVQQTANPFFVSSVLIQRWGKFHGGVITNVHNQQWCAEEDSHDTIHDQHQQQFKIDVWASIEGDHLKGSHVLPQYLDMLCLQGFPFKWSFTTAVTCALAVRAKFMKDGTLAYFNWPVRDVLNNTYQDKCVSRTRPVTWPTRSPNLNPTCF